MFSLRRLFPRKKNNGIESKEIRKHNMCFICTKENIYKEGTNITSKKKSQKMKKRKVSSRFLRFYLYLSKKNENAFISIYLNVII